VTRTSLPQFVSVMEPFCVTRSTSTQASVHYSAVEWLLPGFDILEM